MNPSNLSLNKLRQIYRVSQKEGSTFTPPFVKKTIDARNMPFSANYWYRPQVTLVPISRLYVHFLLNSKLKYEFRSYFQQWPLANKAMPPLIRKRYLTTLLLILSP